MKTVKTIALFFFVLILLASCAPSANELERPKRDENEAAGFWLGLWHGIIAPVTFVISLFSDAIDMYEVENNGGWYNLGFLFGMIVIFGGGGGGAARKGSSRRRD